MSDRSTLRRSDRERCATQFLTPPAGPPAIGDLVRAPWHVTGKRHGARITAINEEDNTCSVTFTDASGDKSDNVPIDVLVRDSGHSGKERPGLQNARPRKKPKQAPEVEWQHRGIRRAFFAPSSDNVKTVADRLMFEFDVAYERNGKLVPGTPETISLRDMVASDTASVDELDMHAAALNDFMKVLLLRTPTAENMEQLLESSGDDPIGDLTPEELAQRADTYQKHAFAAAAAGTSAAP